jgi:hypothetical protein
MKDELLLAILFLGFRRFPASFPVGTSIEFPSPKAGAEPTESAALTLPVTDVSPPSLLGGTWSPDALPSLGCSCILEFTPVPLRFVSIL